MGKRGRNQKKGPQNSKKHKILNDEKDVDFKNLDDEIDAFHKKRDMIPLDINDDNMDSNEEDDEQHIFDYEGIDGDDDDEDDDDDDDDSNLRGLEAKIVRQQKFLREKLGDVDDEVDDDDDDTDQDEKPRKVWSRNKGAYYGSENQDYEIQSSDEDTAAEEEEEVMRLQKERAESLRPEDFGLEVDEEDDSDEAPTFGEMMTKGKPKSKDSSDKAVELDDVPMYEEVKKDLSALSRDEQMDVVYSSAPELVGLLAELSDASKQLETYINPLLSKVTKGERSKKEGLHYLEVKQLLLLAYCQSISFYLLMKSEGQPVRDHPVIARLVEIKNLLEKTKELDVHIPGGFEDALIENSDIATATKPDEQGPVLSSDLVATLNNLTGSLPDKREPSKSREADEPLQMQSAEVHEKKRKTDKGQDQHVSLESVKMLQFRAALEEKLKLKAGSVAPKIEQSQKQKLKKLDGKLETTGDFDDEAMNLDGARHVGRTSTLSSKLSQIVPAKRNRKGVSGDDDMPERDDLGERRWKHELRVLARAGVKSIDEDDIQIENGEGCEGDDDGQLENELGSSEDDESNDFYNQIKHQRDAKLKLKAEKYSRNPQVQPEADITVDGKRHITTQMEKNRGLTRARKKLAKNPRKKYRLQHDKAAKRRKGQVREIRQPKYSYDGEATGINPRISRSTRF